MKLSITLLKEQRNGAGEANSEVYKEKYPIQMQVDLIIVKQLLINLKLTDPLLLLHPHFPLRTITPSASQPANHEPTVKL